jgi:hypothetical protein
MAWWEPLGKRTAWPVLMMASHDWFKSKPLATALMVEALALARRLQIERISPDQTQMTANSIFIFVIWTNIRGPRQRLEEHK